MTEYRQRATCRWIAQTNYRNKTRCVDGVQVVGVELCSLIAVFNKCLRRRHRPTGHRHVTVSGAVYDVRTCRQIKHVDVGDWRACRPISCKQTTEQRTLADWQTAGAGFCTVNIQRLLIVSHRRRPCHTATDRHRRRICCHWALTGQLERSVERTKGRQLS